MTVEFAHDDKTKGVGRCHRCGVLHPVYVTDDGTVYPLGVKRDCGGESAHEMRILSGDRDNAYE